MKEYLKPTKRTEFFFGTIMFIILAISILNFPISSFFSTNPDLQIKFSIGWPVSFFQLNLSDTETMPVKFIPLILSVAIYLLIAYILDVLISLIIFYTRKKQENSEQPLKNEINNIEISPQNNLQKTENNIYEQAKKAIQELESKGKSKEEIKQLFIERGWSENQIQNLF